MALYFQLFKIGSDTPEKLSIVDEEICKHLGAEVSPTQYFAYWFDIIGFQLARGLDWIQVREYLNKNHSEDWVYLDILDFLEKHYSPNGWFGRG